MREGPARLICDELRIQDRQHLKRKSLKLQALSDAAASRLVDGLFSRIAENSPDQPRSASNQLWRSTRETKISDRNGSLEKMLEKSVAILATRGHMPGWFNQCPVATGIVDPFADGGRRIDLVHLSNRAVRLIELKWHSDTPVSALFEVLEYGLAYLLARIRRHEFNLGAQPLMHEQVTEVRLEVVGPPAFYDTGSHPELFAAIANAIARLASAQTNGLSMSLHALVFPAWFDGVPFESGREVKAKCGTRALTDEGRRVCAAFAQLAPALGTTSRHQRFLKGVPGADIERILDAAAGNEIQSGKFDHLESSAALAVNAFGFSLHRPTDLPVLPGLEHRGWPARSLYLERTVRFPWHGGRHPVLDCLLTTASALIGIECKRFEPFRQNANPRFSDTYWRPVWGERMEGYQHVRDRLRADGNLYSFLDAAQLVKHALGLRAEVRRDRHRSLAPILLYVYAEPDTWPSTGRQLGHDHKARHRDEITHFAKLVAGDEVAFAACSYRQLLGVWQRDGNHAIGEHAAAVVERF